MLTDTAIRKAKVQDKPYKLSDINGLHVYVTKAGSKIFRYRYEFLGKEKTLVIGDYPEMSLLEARRARDEARQLLKSGRDPSLCRPLTGFRPLAGQLQERFELVLSDEDNALPLLHGYDALSIVKLEFYGLILEGVDGAGCFHLGHPSALLLGRC
ncbi:Arm DNA-binding domain-containing protein [Agrobacterium genomosp. 13]|uniref:Arm DNA-binding domain-containing protein n=1 Tax=Agrobacterium genomosp. 13 TaxID=1183419 RepID=UPI0009B9D271|nr:Arm DNA-binding domain-containing protein [Agrobacterium genomosp. 13]